jgi:uncharacterized protein
MTRVALATLFLCLACERTEEPQSRRPAQTAENTPRPQGDGLPGPEAEPATAATRPGNAERCLVPLPPEPPPPVEAARACPADPEGRPELAKGQVVFVDAPGAPAVHVELARTPEHRDRGLMYRTTMAQNEGMLFSWLEEAPRTFWMRNTCLPLDMLAIAADGTVVSVLERVPTLNEAPRRMPCPAAHVLEVNAGWVRRHGVAPGQKVRIEP